MISLALALTLSWTVPTRTAEPCSCGLYVPREARVYRHVQAPAWRAMWPAMQLDGDVFAAAWPAVKREAAPVLVATIPLGHGDQGRRLTWTNPKADTVTAFYFVTTVDTAGRESRISNEVGR